MRILSSIVAAWIIVGFPGAEFVARVRAEVQIVSIGPPRVAVVAPPVPVVQSAPVEPVEPTPVYLAYPTRRSNWSYPGNIRSHVMSGEHRGKLDPAWVATQSDASLRAWHSDDHEGRVKWEYVVRPSSASPATQAKPRATSSYCPSGNCPTSRPGLFGRLLGR